MLRVVVNYGDPFQLGTSVLLDSLQHIAGQPLEVNAVAELGREYQLPEAVVPGRLPFAESTGHVDALPPSKPAAFCSCSMVALSRAT